MNDFSGYFIFRLDSTLSQETRKVLEQSLSEYKSASMVDLKTPVDADHRVVVDFVAESSLPELKTGPTFKICLLDRNQGLFSFGQNVEESAADAILDHSFDMGQIERLLRPNLERVVALKETELFHLSVKNLRKFEQLARSINNTSSWEESSGITSESLLDYIQALVDLEKELIQTDETSKLSKILKQFTKNHIEKSRFQLKEASELWEVEASKNLLPLPKFRGSFICMELNWDDEDVFRLIKKLFFYQTLINFFSSGQTTEDPFAKENLWEGVLDSIPFPVALLTASGEICQHNTLFAKLNYPPADCLSLKVKDKIVIHDIPYNIFRKDIFHLDSNKVLFVFFTESFFLKGEGNLTPSGQELGIISSSIAHELNNPIAGIQAALSLLMLDDELNEEAKSTLVEMKNGAVRCKQLIETFLGFSRANPNRLQCIEERLSPVELCYQQALNLLRFRTVESGIRFSFTYSKHTDFRHQINLSLFTMTLYLIMGELMTMYSHHMLVTSKNQVEKVIKGEIIESSQEVQIQLHELNISSLQLSKLIQNLLTIENFVPQVSDYSLRFIFSPPRS